MAQPIKRIVCVGAGYVGGPTMAVISLKCPDIIVTVVDIDSRKIDLWNSQTLPIHEPGLEDVVFARRGKNLFFSTDVEGEIKTADMVFISVGTPTKNVGTGAGRAPLIGYVESAARTIGRVARHNTIVVEKSTVPVGVSQMIRAVLNNNASGIKFTILSNPEFLAEGTAMKDLDNPDRILIGHELTPDGEIAAQTLADLYAAWVPREKILTTNVWSSELSKLAANAFLAQRISSINAISAVCERSGADVNEVARAIGMDSRIGPKFLKASVGFGGSCFQKDVLNLVYIAESLGLPEVAEYWQQVINMNNYQRERFYRDIVHTMFDTLLDKKIAIFGFAFKADTGDTRESSSIYIVDYLLQERAQIRILDPQVTKAQMYFDLKEVNSKFTETFLDKYITVCSTPDECVTGSHAIAVLTEWPVFTTYDYKHLHSLMEKPSFVFDGRNLLDRQMLREAGFTTHGIGVKPDELK